MRRSSANVQPLLARFDQYIVLEHQASICNPARTTIIDAAGALPLRVIVPFTGWKAHFSRAPWLVRIAPDGANGLVKDSASDAVRLVLGL